MTRDELLETLRTCVEIGQHDPEAAHSAADEALVKYLNDTEIRALYDSLDRWCA